MGWDGGTVPNHGSRERQERHEEINKHVKVKTYVYIYMVGGFKAVLFSIIYGMSSFPLTFICFKTVKTTRVCRSPGILRFDPMFSARASAVWSCRKILEIRYCINGIRSGHEPCIIYQYTCIYKPVQYMDSVVYADLWLVYTYTYTVLPSSRCLPLICLLNSCHGSWYASHFHVLAKVNCIPWFSQVPGLSFLAWFIMFHSIQSWCG